ncbi:MAG TPA: hypothetical protein VG963_18005 [Polyangiaceae bacterium]|nr:hypothetical protein [Polyangiaceae bacterium]
MFDPATEPENRQRAFIERSAVLAFGGGLLVAFVSSSGLVSNRLSGGRLPNAILGDIVVLCAVVVTKTLTARPLNVSFEQSTCGAPVATPPRHLYAILVAQCAGATLGTVAVHALLMRSGLSSLAWMCECPPQLMNDAVATFGALAAVWACVSRKLRIELLIGALGVLLMYGSTRHHWHVDRAPFAFEWTIQELVVAQVIAVATGLLAFRRFAPA